MCYCEPPVSAYASGSQRRAGHREENAFGQELLISRARVAPSAIRTANSRLRTDARASSRFARFAQTISSTKPTAAQSTKSDRRMRPLTCSFRSVSVAPQRPQSLCSLNRRGISAANSARASGSVTPGRSRPITESVFPQGRITSRSAGTNMSTCVPGVNTEAKSNEAGMMPTTVTCAPLIVMALPTRLGSPPNGGARDHLRAARGRPPCDARVGEEAAARGLDAEDFEEARSDINRHETLRLTSAGQRLAEPEEGEVTVRLSNDRALRWNSSKTSSGTSGRSARRSVLEIQTTGRRSERAAAEHSGLTM